MTPTQMKHAETPWVLDDSGGLLEILDGHGNIIVSWAGFGAGGKPIWEKRAKAARIVRCVNSHDELVKALTALVDVVSVAARSHGLPVQGELEDARAILANKEP